MDIQYFKKWFRKGGHGIGPISQIEAKTFHEQGIRYIAVVDGKYIVDVAPPWYSVYFLDSLQRIFLEYDFQVIESRLFLKGAKHRQFTENTTNVSVYHGFNFEQSGAYITERQETTTEQKQGMFRTDALWESIPEFGFYDQLLVIERGMGDLM